MKASLKEFLQTGVLGRVELGTSRADIERILGSPQSWEAKAHNYQQASIWKYGDVEFYFRDDLLSMVFMDDFEVPTGGQSIDLESWIVRRQLTCSEAEQYLDLAAITYRKEIFPCAENAVHLITGAGTVLAFSTEDANRQILYAIYRRITVPQPDNAT